MKRQLHLTVGMRLLDVGCGRGSFLNSLHREMPSLRLFGLERDVRRALDAMRLTEASVLVGDGQVLPFRSGTFDRVVLGYALHHMSPSVRGRVLAEIARVLQTGGRLLVIEKAAPRGWLERLGLSIQVLSGGEDRQVYSLFGEGLTGELEAAGLSVLSDQEVKRRRVASAVPESHTRNR